MRKLPVFQKWEAVRFEWKDSITNVGEWTAIGKKDRNIHGCITVGQVYKQDEDKITLVFCWDPESKNANGFVTIPVVAITDWQRLSG